MLSKSGDTANLYTYAVMNKLLKPTGVPKNLTLKGRKGASFKDQVKEVYTMIKGMPFIYYTFISHAIY